MRKYYLLLVLVLPFVLMACGVNYTQKISYDGKGFVLESKGHGYEQVAVKEIPDVYVGSSLKLVYLEEAVNKPFSSEWDLPLTGEKKISDEEKEDSDYFRDSLFFAQEEVDEDMVLSQFVDDNMSKILAYYEIEKEDDRSQESFICKSKVISSELVTYTVFVNNGFEEEKDIEKSLYFAEYFYIHAGEANVISFVSDTESERNLFISSMDSFECK